MPPLALGEEGVARGGGENSRDDKGRNIEFAFLMLPFSILDGKVLRSVICSSKGKSVPLIFLVR